MPALNEVLAADLDLPANCFMIGRHSDLVEGIQLQLDKGPDPLRPWEPFIAVGDKRVHRDCWFDKEHRRPFGCVYHLNNGTAFVRRMQLGSIELSNGHTISVLHRPTEHTESEYTVLVDLSIPDIRGLRKNGRELHIHHGVSGTGNIVMSKDDVVLVQLKSGEHVNLFFRDGAVRQLTFKKGELHETPLTRADMASLRVHDAKVRLNEASATEGEEDRKHTIYPILAGMANLLQLTAADKDGQDIRRLIISEFFLELEGEHLNLVHRKLKAILHSVDSALLPMISPEKKQDEQSNVVEFDQLRDKFRVSDAKASADKLAKSKQKKAVRQERDREYRDECKGGAAGGQKNKKR